MVNHSCSAVDLEPQIPVVLKPKVKSSRTKKDKEEKNFFRQAAALANHKWDEEFLLSSLPIGEELTSDLLDESFQERFELFIHKPVPEATAEQSSHEFNQALKSSHSIQNFLMVEESALSFHQKLQSLASEESPWPLMLLLNQSLNWFLADRVRLFCSLRLKKKSLQRKIGADPKIRYFHAVVRDSKRPKKTLDLLYWLQFDDEQNVIDGDFIKSYPRPHFLLKPKELLNHFGLAEISPPVTCMLNKTLKALSGRA